MSADGNSVEHTHPSFNPKAAAAELAKNMAWAAWMLEQMEARGYVTQDEITQMINAELDKLDGKDLKEGIEQVLLADIPPGTTQ